MSGETGRSSSREVAHEAEDTRAHLASTLEQLRTNLRPENVVDEVVSNARIGASTVADNLMGVAKANPIPSLLIAAGVALVMGVFSRGKSVPRSVVVGRARDPLSRAPIPSDPASLAPAATWSADGMATGGDASSLKDDVERDTSDRRSQRAAGVGGLKRQASDAYRSTAASARDAMQSVSHYIPRDRSEAKSKLSNLLDEQPLVLGAIGLAIGAAIGAALPITEAEDSLMGGTAHQLRQAASDVARHEVDGLRAVAGEAVENVKKSAVDHGLSADNLNDLVKDVGSHAKTAVNKVGSAHDA